MNLKEIEDLIKFVSKSGVNEVQIEDKDFKITIKAGGRQKEAVAAVPQVINVAPPAPAPASPVAATPSPAATPPSKPTDESKYITIKSPMIGTFYRASSPDKAPFVNIGDEVKPGKVICIIEAMKLFNEIESEVSGKIVKVLVENSSPVEYDQPLFLVEPA